MLFSWPHYPAFVTFRFGVSQSLPLAQGEGIQTISTDREACCSKYTGSCLLCSAHFPPCPQDPRDDVTALCLHGRKAQKNPPLGSPELGKGHEESRPATVSPVLLSGCLEVQNLLFPGRKYPCLVSTPRRIFVESLRKIPSRWESEKSLCLSLLEKKKKKERTYLRHGYFCL